MDKTGLILEGGGMRGAYTAGVLDYLMDADLHFPYVVGASAGACNGSSYVAKQKGRNYKVIVGYGNHPEYISYRNIFRKKGLFGMDFIFDTLPNQLVPFDYDRFFSSVNAGQTFVIGTTDIQTGEPVYFDSFNDGASLLKLIRASSSLPLIAPMIEYNNRQLMDGGIADPVPIQPSIDAGNKKHVIILTRNEGYKKQKMKFSWLFNKKYKDYPMLTKALLERHEKYNRSTEAIEQMEREGKAYIIRPKHQLEVSRIERNQNKLHSLYEQGYNEAHEHIDDLKAFLHGTAQLA
ncbi:patatin family protein [Pontibacillus yanchengensis]|uniref:Patatin family protein n=2 Tax=Pontibacillus yanchengensis TaxID=462910 RepID=A0ACC7VDC9_9BACI|nr:patatin family protein [Pontibacillus yanchengensis]MYL34798.1 patatin family protein [Pontibacillus yanchengensis]MYL52216.1 patatin family protein [Pontibacillus yanchengensis]